MSRTFVRRSIRIAQRLLLLGASLIVLFFSAALLGALIPTNSDFVSADTGVTIWVRGSDIHTDIIVPAKNEVFDWNARLPRTDAAAVDDRYQLLALGWGDRRFYLETPTWSDVKAANVLTAFIGLDETAMHVDWTAQAPVSGERCREITITEEQYERLCRHIWSSFEQDNSGSCVPIEVPGYGPTDAFYEAEGHYSALQTCNTWIGESLEAGGVRVGVWTPLPWGVFWSLPKS